MVDSLQVGPPSASSLPPSAVTPIRGGQLGDLIQSNLHGQYYEQAYRKNLFYSYVAAQTLTASATGYTGNVIYNSSPVGGVNLVLNQISIGVSVTSASMTGIALAYNIQSTAPTGLTAATATGPAFIGQAVGFGLAYKAATLAFAGTAFYPLLHNTAAIATTGIDSFFTDIQGGIIIPPGYCVGLVALGAASAASAVTSTIMWEEVPV